MKSIDYEGKEKIEKKIPNKSLSEKGNTKDKIMNSGSAGSTPRSAPCSRAEQESGRWNPRPKHRVTDTTS